MTTTNPTAHEVFTKGAAGAGYVPTFRADETNPYRSTFGAVYPTVTIADDDLCAYLVGYLRFCGGMASKAQVTNHVHPRFVPVGYRAGFDVNAALRRLVADGHAVWTTRGGYPAVRLTAAAG